MPRRVSRRSGSTRSTSSNCKQSHAPSLSATTASTTYPSFWPNWLQLSMRQLDTKHNYEYPCSLLLQEIAQHIFTADTLELLSQPHATSLLSDISKVQSVIKSETVNSPDEFILYFLLKNIIDSQEHSKTPQTTTVERTALAKSKRKRKKKKKTISLSLSTSTVVDHTDGECKPNNDNDDEDDEQEHETHEMVNSSDHNETFRPALARVSESTRENDVVSVSDLHHPLNSLFDLSSMSEPIASSDASTPQFENDTNIAQQWHLNDFLEQMVDQISLSSLTKLKEKETVRRHDEFWRRLLQQASRGCLVSPTLLNQVVSNIQCGDCQKQVRNILEIETVIPLTRTVINNNQLPVMNESKKDTASAFDYVAMEEGMAPTLSANILSSEPTFAFELTAVDSTDVLCASFTHSPTTTMAWQLRRSDRQPWTMEDVNLILYEYVLGRGLPQDDRIELSNLSEHTINLIRIKVQTNCRALVEMSNQLDQEFTNVSQTLLQAIVNSKFSSYPEDDSNSSEVDVKTFPILKACDDQCSVLLDRCFQIIVGVTKSFWLGLYNPFMNESTWRQQDNIHSQQKQLLLFIRELWEHYLTGVQDCIQHQLKYEQSMTKRANPRTGVLPAHFYSADSRKEYATLIHFKLQVLRSLVDQLWEILNAPVESGIQDYYIYSFSSQDCNHSQGLDCHMNSSNFNHSNKCHSTPMKLLTKINFWHVYQSTVLQEQTQAREAAALNGSHNSACEPLDEAYFKLFTVLRECVDTVIRGNLEQVVQEHDRRRDQLTRLYHAVLVQMKSLIEDCDSRETRNKSNSLHKEYLEIKSEIDNTRVSLDALFAASSGNRSDQYFSEESDNYDNYQLPSDVSDDDRVARLHVFRLNLKKGAGLLMNLWLKIKFFHGTKLAISTTKYPLDKIPMQVLADYVQDTRQSCLGGSGKNRAACILVALVYSWMLEVCFIWRAELAEQELLASTNGSCSVKNIPPSTPSTLPHDAIAKPKKVKKKKSGVFAEPETSIVRFEIESSPHNSLGIVSDLTTGLSHDDGDKLVHSNVAVLRVLDEQTDEKKDDSEFAKLKSPRAHSLCNVSPSLVDDTTIKTKFGLDEGNEKMLGVGLCKTSEKCALAPIDNLFSGFDKDCCAESLEPDYNLDSFLKMGFCENDEFVSIKEFLVSRFMKVEQH